MWDNPLDFSFDNETPRHRVYLQPFQIAKRSVTCREYLEFMSDDGYSRPGLWLSDGWELVKQLKWEAPLYWERDAGDETGWQVFTLRGSHGLSDLLDTAVCHISFYEAMPLPGGATVGFRQRLNGNPSRARSLCKGIRLMREVASCN